MRASYDSNECSTRWLIQTFYFLATTAIYASKVCRLQNYESYASEEAFKSQNLTYVPNQKARKHLHAFFPFERAYYA